MGDGNGVGALLLGLEGFRVLAALEENGEVFVLVETTGEVVGCPECGVRARIKERPCVEVRDVAVAGRPTRLVWRKRRWQCPDADCPKGSWRERHEAIRPRALLSERARRDILERVGRHGQTVADLAGEYGVAWGTAMRAVVELGLRWLMILIASVRLFRWGWMRPRGCGPRPRRGPGGRRALLTSTAVCCLRWWKAAAQPLFGVVGVASTALAAAGQGGCAGSLRGLQAGAAQRARGPRRHPGG